MFETKNNEYLDNEYINRYVRDIGSTLSVFYRRENELKFGECSMIKLRIMRCIRC